MKTQFFCPKCKKPLEVEFGEILLFHPVCHRNMDEFEKDFNNVDQCNDCETFFHREEGTIVRFNEESSCKLCNALFHVDEDIERIKRGE